MPIVDRRQHPFCKALAAAEKPLILYGSAVLERDDSASIMKLLKSLNAQTKVCEGKQVIGTIVFVPGEPRNHARRKGIGVL